MSRPPSTRSRSNPNPGLIQIQADKEAVALARTARAEKRTTARQAQRNTKIDRLSAVEHELMQVDLDEQTPHAPKHPRKPKGLPNITEDFEEPPTPAPSKLMNCDDFTNRDEPTTTKPRKTAQGGKGSLREAVTQWVDRLAAGVDAPSTKKGHKRTGRSLADQGADSVEDDPHAPKKGKYLEEESDREVTAQRSGGSGRG